MARVNVDRKSLSALSKAIGKADNKSLRVGWFDSAKYDDSTPVAGVAAKNEYGSPSENIPSRPFLRNTIESQSENWEKIMEAGANSVMSGSSSIDSMLNKLGLKASADIKNGIVKGNFVALSPFTIAARLKNRADGKTVGSLNKPLVDQGIMISTITHEVS